MAINRKELRNERQWRATLGVNKKEFEKLSKLTGEAYEDIHGISLSEQIAEYSEDVFFKSYKDIVFFTLFSLKNDLGYDVLGLCFDISRSTAFNKQTIGVRYLQAALQRKNYIPHREFVDYKDLKSKLANYDELLIDATEQHRQRPVNQEVQKENYSGKKKHTP